VFRHPAKKQEEKKRKWLHSSNQNTDCLKTTQTPTLFSQHTTGRVVNILNMKQATAKAN
jgi:hypothetical protein